MIFYPDELIDRWIDEDVPGPDLTSWLLGIGAQSAEINFRTRAPVVVAGSAVAARVLERCGARITGIVASGEHAASGAILLRATGDAAHLHRGWKVAQNLLEQACGIATHTRELVARARTVRPDLPLYATRKYPPGFKRLAMEAYLAGGALPHRLGLSETVLVFPQHLAFVGGLEGLLERLDSLRPRLVEKALVVEVESLEQARVAARAGVDVLQFDKLPAGGLRTAVEEIRTCWPRVRLLAAGGIGTGNIDKYAATGVDGLVLSSVYRAEPADIGVRLAPAT